MTNSSFATAAHADDDDGRYSTTELLLQLLLRIVKLGSIRI
jgi:hypothetical protein